MRLFCGVLVLFSGPIKSLISRTLPEANHVLPIHQPRYPEHYYCDPAYGQDIVPLDCRMAVDLNWPKGRTLQHYYFRDPAASNSIRLPVSDHEGSCTVSIESAGPGKETHWVNAETQNYFSISPDKLRGLAGFLIQACAQEEGGIGGYVTMRFSAANNWLASLATSFSELVSSNGTDGRPNDGQFLTISITNSAASGSRPGDTDPNVAGTLAEYAYNVSREYSAAGRPRRKEYYEHVENELLRKCEYMERCDKKGASWWGGLDEHNDLRDMEGGPDDDSGDNDGRESTASSPADRKSQDRPEAGEEPDKNPTNSTTASDMTYQCDAHLGAPSATDCDQLAWSGLKPATSIETLQPHVPKFYTQGTCALGISSSTAVTITWAHLLAAFETLNNLCVQNPIRNVQGGRAFQGVQGVQNWLGGKKRSVMTTRDSVGGVRGTEALPEGINATVWRHDGSGGRATLECEWMKVMGGEDVGGCVGG